MTEPASPGVESLRSFALVTVGCAAAVVALRQLGYEPYSVLAVAAILHYAAFHGAERMPGGVARAGIGLGGLLASDAEEHAPRRPAEREGPFGLLGLGRAILRGAPSALRETAIAFALAALVFPPFYLGYVRWFGLRGEFDWHVPTELASLALTQLVLVAVPEEIYFRGYLQTRLSDALPAKLRVGRVELPVVAILVQAALFGVLHFVVEPRPERLAVAFPALLFGALATARGGVGASIVFHALCNLCSETLALSVR